MYNVVLKLCADSSYDYTVKKFDMMLEFETLDLDGESINLLFQNLLDIGYIHEVKHDTYSIFSKEAYERFHEIRINAGKLFAESASQN